MCGGRSVIERAIEGEQVATYVRNPQTKHDELTWRPRVQTVACPCVMRAGLPTAEACGLGGLEGMLLETFETDDLVADGQVRGMEEVRAFAAGLPGTALSGAAPGFVFYGHNGNGKTHLAAALARAALAAGVRPRFLEERQLYGRFSAAYGAGEGDEGVVLVLSTAAVLIVDDVGKGYTRAGGGTSEEEAGWRASCLEQVLGARQRARKPTILTTNVMARDWPRRFGNALADRLTLLVPLYFGGESRR